MTGALDSRDRLMLRSATRRISLQSAVVLAVFVAVAVVVGTVVFDRMQHAEIERTVRDAALSADDVGDPPRGVVLIETRDGTTQITPDADRALLVLASLPEGLHSAKVDGRGYITYARTRGDARFVAAYDLAGHHRAETRLLRTAVGTGVAGVALAALMGWLIGRRAVRPLADALSLQRRFVTDASHELRTPLTVLHTRAQILRRRLAARVSAEELVELNQLVEDTSALGEVVEDLLLSAQLQRDSVAGARVDVAALATAVVASLQPLALEGGTTLRSSVQAGEWEVAGAPVALRRALVALVDNAISHTPGGSVVVAVDGDDSEVRLAVTDDGEGLVVEDAARLTERFARGEARGGHQRRFGLGLALVDEVVRAHGGRLQIDGQQGAGAVFSIHLPRE